MKNSAKYLTILYAAVLLLSPLYTSARSTSDQRIENMSRGPVELTFSASSSSIDYKRDILLTIQSVTDASCTVSIPSIEGRLSGFVLNGEYEEAPVVQEGKTIVKKHIRLTPIIANEYRIAPLAITYSENRSGKETSNWFPTKPFIFDAPVLVDSNKDDIDASINPIWIYPSIQEFLLYIFIAILAGISIWFLIRLIRYFKKEAEIRRMSPTDRALRELDLLLSQHLPEQGCFKQFYLELTMIVRRYIERAHHVKAPEQTTEEFLQAVSNDSRFNEQALTTLKQFLEAADLVKFAAYQPKYDSTQQAADTARNYIRTDIDTEANND